jgi:hypothetical protein
LLDLLFELEDGGDTRIFLWTVRLLLNYTVLQPRRTYSLLSLLWEPQIQHTNIVYLQIVDQLMDIFVQCYSSVSGTLNVIWPNQYVRLFQPFRGLKIVLFHKLVKWCIDEVHLPVNKVSCDVTGIWLDTTTKIKVMISYHISVFKTEIKLK